MPNIDRAKQIVVEILRVSGGRLESTTRLFKAFYFAHLYYARAQAGYLSDWPIIHMLRGPGIKDADKLLDELQAEGRIEIHQAANGPFSQKEYRTTDKDTAPEPLSVEAIDAIRMAVRFVKGKTGAELTDITHEHSRSWKSTEMDEELDIYIDLSSDEEFEKRREAFRSLDPILSDVWGR